MINTLFLDTAADTHKQTCMASRAILSEGKTNNLKTWTRMVGGAFSKLLLLKGGGGGGRVHMKLCFFGRVKF